MAAGWKFTVSVPQWIDGKDEEGQDVVLYRVNVLLQAPGSLPSTNARPPFFVLRRYNQFRHLYEQLKLALPDLMKDRNLAPPPKHALHIRGSKEMCDRRRADLEAWMWKLLGQPAITRSTALRAFLEWDRALMRAQAARPVGPDTGSSSQARSTYAGSEIGDMDSVMDTPYGGGGHSPTASISSNLTDLNLHPSHVASPPQLDQQARLVPQQQQLMHAVLQAGSHDSLQGLRGQSEVGADLGVAQGVARRLGVRLEHRADVRRIVAVLQARLDQAATDMQGALHEANVMREANRLLTSRVTELQTVAQSAGPAGAGQHELEQQVEELKAQLAEVLAAAGGSPDRGRAEQAGGGMQEELTRAKEQARAAEAGAEQLSLELEQMRLQLSDSEDMRLELAQRLAQAEGAVAGRVQMLTSQVTSLQQQLEESHKDNQGLLDKMHDWGVTSKRLSNPGQANTNPGQPRSQTVSSSGSSAAANGGATAAEALAALQSRLSASEAEHAAAMQALATVQAELEAERNARVADKARARDNQTVLAREVKKLRGELAAAQAARAMPVSTDTSAASAAPVAAAATVQSEHQTSELVQTLQREKSELQQQLELLSNDKSQLQRQLELLLNDKSELQRQSESLTNDKSELQQQAEILKSEIAQLSSEEKRLKGEMEVAGMLHGQACELSRHMHHVTSILLDSGTSLQETAAKLTTAESDLLRLQQLLEEANQQLQLSRLEQEQQVQQQQALQAELEATRLQQVQLLQQQKTLQGQLEAAQLERQQVSAQAEPETVVPKQLQYQQVLQAEVVTAKQELQQHQHQQEVGWQAELEAVVQQEQKALQTELEAAADTSAGGSASSPCALLQLAINVSVDSSEQQGNGDPTTVFASADAADATGASQTGKDALLAQQFELASSQARLESSQTELQGLAACQAELLACHEQLADSRQQWQEQLEACQAELQACQAQLAERHVQLEQFAACQQQLEQLGACQAELTACQAQLLGSQAQLEQLAAELGSCQSQLADLQSEVTASKEALSAYQLEAAAQQQAHSQQLQLELTAADEQVTGLTAQLAAANEQLAIHASQVAAAQEQLGLQAAELAAVQEQQAAQAAELSVLQEAQVSRQVLAGHMAEIERQATVAQAALVDADEKLHVAASSERLDSLSADLGSSMTSAAGLKQQPAPPAAPEPAPEPAGSSSNRDVVKQQNSFSELQTTIAQLEAEVAGLKHDKQALELQAVAGQKLARQARELTEQLAALTELAEQRTEQLAGAEQRLQEADAKLQALKDVQHTQRSSSLMSPGPGPASRPSLDPTLDMALDATEQDHVVAAQAGRIRTLQQELADRDAAIEAQEAKLQQLATHVAAHNSAASAAAHLATSPSRLPGPPDPTFTSAPSGTDDFLIALDDNDTNTPVQPLVSPKAWPQAASPATDANGQPGPELLGGLQAQAASLQSELGAVQRQLQAVAADRDRLRVQLEQAKATADAAGPLDQLSPSPSGGAAATRTGVGMQASGGGGDNWLDSMLQALQQAAQALAAIKQADTGPALRKMEAEVEGAIVKARGLSGTGGAAGAPAEAVAAAADTAMDEFLLALSASSEQLEQAAGQVSQLSTLLATSPTVPSNQQASLLDPSPSSSAQQLQARLVPALCEPLTLLTACHAALNELRCDKAMSAGARAADTVRRAATAPPAPTPSPQGAPTHQPSPLVPAGIRRAVSGQPPPQLQPATSGGRQVPEQLHSQQAPAAGAGNAAHRGSALNAVSSVLGSGFFGGPPSGPPVPMHTLGHAPVAQSGVFARLIGGGPPSQGVAQPGPVRPMAPPIGSGYTPPRYVDDGVSSGEQHQGMNSRGAHYAQSQQQQQQQSQQGGLFGALGQRVTGAVAGWGMGSNSPSTTTQDDMFGDLLGDPVPDPRPQGRH